MGNLGRGSKPPGPRSSSKKRRSTGWSMNLFLTPFRAAAQTAASATALRFCEARLIRESGGPSMRPMIGKPRM
eukprot:797528-Heterocapsa_arctica.AAC.1